MLNEDLFDFLKELKANNSREWFQANKQRYEAEVREPLMEFIRQFEPHLEEISPYFLAIAKKSGGSMFRIHRDVRFSKDKSPYKTHASLHFRHENGKDVHCPGFYLHLEPGECFCGAGMWHPDSPSLRAVREAIVEKPIEWVKVSRSDAFETRGESLKRAPRGFDPDHELIDDLRLKDHVAVVKLTEKNVLGKDFLQNFVEHCGAMAPYVRFQCEALGQPF